MQLLLYNYFSLLSPSGLFPSRKGNSPHNVNDRHRYFVTCLMSLIFHIDSSVFAIYLKYSLFVTKIIKLNILLIPITLSLYICVLVVFIPDRMYYYLHIFQANHIFSMVDIKLITQIARGVNMVYYFRHGRFRFT